MGKGVFAGTGVVAALATAAVLIVGVSPASANQDGAGSSAAKPAVKAKFLTRSQGSLAGGRATVRLSLASRHKKTKRAFKVKLKLQVKQPWSPWTAAGSGNARVRPGKVKVGRVQLNRQALAIVRNCGTPQLRLKSGGRTVATSAKLKMQRWRCAVPDDVDLSKADKCDFIAPFANPCLAPFPDDFYTRADKTSETGRRVDFDPEATPQNHGGTHIGVTELNRSDGFSPGQSISVQIPGMDNQAAFDKTGIVPITDMSQTYAPNQPVLLIDAKTGKRQLIWAELDYNASKDRWRNLIIRPGKNLTNGHRYIVALRNMKDASGKKLAPPPGFRIYRNNNRTLNKTIEKRRNRYESIFKTLAKKGVKRSSLYMAWDFTVASTENLTGRMLSIRDRAFADLGDTNLADGIVQGNSPDFQINPNNPGDNLRDGIIDYPTATGDGVENIRTINGTFTVPCYLNKVGCGVGGTFNLDADQKPIRIPGNTFTARFTCNIPRSAIDGSGNVIEKVRPSLYGHGLFGEYTETNTRNARQLGTEDGVMVCGTDWIGMASSDDNDPLYDDLPSAITALQDLSKFPALPDRLQQGFLDFMFLGRLMIHSDGFTSNAAFKFNGESVIDTHEVFYYGNSQGGIAGGALTAVSPDVTRSVLYVPGMNYSTLLPRSQDFRDYAVVMYPSYTEEIERPLVFSLIQMMWDRGEPNGYANSMTSNPLPNTPAHKVMLMMAWGDHEVANVATEVEARTIGAPLRSPTLDANREPAGMVNPFYGHEILGDLNGPAADGNAFVVWDTGPKRSDPPGTPIGNTVLGVPTWGTDPAPLTNTQPNDTFGQNPHDTVIRQSNLARKQIADFINTNGKVTNPCGLNPCYAAGWNGFP